MPVRAAQLNQPLVAFQTTAHAGALGPLVLARLAHRHDRPGRDRRDEEGRGHRRGRPAPAGALRPAGARARCASRARSRRPRDQRGGRRRRAVRTGGGTRRPRPRSDHLPDDVAGFEAVSTARDRGAARAEHGRTRRGADVLRRAARAAVQPRRRVDGRDRGDGDFDGKHHTLAGEQLPAQLELDGVPFKFGSIGDRRKERARAEGPDARAAGRSPSIACTSSPRRSTATSRPLVGAHADGDRPRVAGAGRPVGEPAEGAVARCTNRSCPARADAAVSSTAEVQDGWRVQWDPRPGAVSGIDQIRPGFVKRDEIAWIGTHRHAPEGNQIVRLRFRAGTSIRTRFVCSTGCSSANFAAYLVGGSVRDLMLGRRPKDFDIGTDAHPYQIKRLFRNCWIIGRRFRLAHIKFGQKTIEVATFRKYVPEPPPAPAAEPDLVEPESAVVALVAGAGDRPPAGPRRSASSIATTRSARPRRTRSGATSRSTACSTTSRRSRSSTTSAASRISSGASSDRLAIRSCASSKIPCACSARPSSARGSASISTNSSSKPSREHRALISKASPSRLMEEYFKILRSGYAEAEVPRARPRAAARADDAGAEVGAATPCGIRSRGSTPIASGSRRRPPELTNAVLDRRAARAARRRSTAAPSYGDDPRADRVSFGMLPVPKRDIERLRHMLQMRAEADRSRICRRVSSAACRIGRRSPDALTWLEIFGDAPDAVAHWKEAFEARAPHAPAPHGHAAHGHAALSRARRRTLTRPIHPATPHGGSAGAPNRRPRSRGRPRRRRPGRRGRDGAWRGPAAQ